MAYAVTYLVGTAFIVWFLPNVGPKLMGVNLEEEAQKLRANYPRSDAGGGDAVSLPSAAVRAYRLTSPDLINQSVAELEGLPKKLGSSSPESAGRQDHRARLRYSYP